MTQLERLQHDGYKYLLIDDVRLGSGKTGSVSVTVTPLKAMPAFTDKTITAINDGFITGMVEDKTGKMIVLLNGMPAENQS